MKSVVFVLIAFISIGAKASSPDPKAIAQLDKNREGNLPAQVLDVARRTLPNPCDTKSQILKIDVTKLASDSTVENMLLDSNYMYDAQYLVTQKCLSNSSLITASIEVAKSFIYTASFTGTSVKGSHSSKPKKMQDLKVELKKEITETNGAVF